MTLIGPLVAPAEHVPFQLLKVRAVKRTPLPVAAVSSGQYPLISREYALLWPMKFSKVQVDTEPDPPLDLIINIWSDYQV